MGSWHRQQKQTAGSEYLGTVLYRLYLLSIQGRKGLCLVNLSYEAAETVAGYLAAVELAAAMNTKSLPASV